MVIDRKISKEKKKKIYRKKIRGFQVLQLDLETKETIKVWNSVKEAASSLNRDLGQTSLFSVIGPEESY